MERDWWATIHGDTLSTEEPKGVDPESRVELHQLQQCICSHASFAPPPPLWEWSTPSNTTFKGAPKNQTRNQNTWYMDEMFLKIKINVKSSLWTKHQNLKRQDLSTYKTNKWLSTARLNFPPWEPIVQKTVANLKHLISGDHSKVTIFAFVASYLWGDTFETTKISCYQSSATALESVFLLESITST